MISAWWLLLVPIAFLAGMGVMMVIILHDELQEDKQESTTSMEKYNENIKNTG